MSIEELIAEEEHIKAGFVAEARAFKRIADGLLYKSAGYKTFEDYADKRAGCGARHGWRMVKAGGIVEELLAAPIGKLWLPTNERQAREFAKLKPPRNAPDKKPDLAHAAQVVYDRAPKKNGEPVITAESIRETFIHDKILPPPPKRSAESIKAQKDKAIRQSFVRLWDAFAELKVDPEEAAAQFSDYVFGDGFDEALVYMLRLSELRDG